MELSEYKNLFGAPGTGAHKYRIFDIAIVDVGSTIIFAFLIARFFNWTFWKVLVVLFITGIFAHRLFSVRTTLDKIIFPKG